MKYIKGKTYTTHDNKKVHIISAKPNGVNGMPLYTIKINGEFAGVNPEPVIDKLINKNTEQ